MTSSLKIAGALSAALLATACGEVAQNPDTVRMNVRDGGVVITGTYRASGFDQFQVRQMAGRICTSAGFSGYNQTVNGDAVSFSVSCAAPTRYSAGADALFELQDDGMVDYTINYTQNGRPLQSGGSLRV
ncbi:MAG: hypothetical protein AAFN94_05160 [Pseudomonadota bacterium]